ncbi:MAG: DUF72 domain-containing protein [Spirochaetales bacterium]|nr:DUF72 domain-containing protein [Spirochaetales bacterium]
MPAKIYIGTSGYSYDDWVGPFYPPGTGKSTFLDFYASRFSMVELNFTYYRQPEPRTLSGMIAATGENFLFSIKAHRSLTHDIDPDPGHAVSAYLRGVEPLAASGRLGAVLLQFPYSFHYTVDNRKYLAALCGALTDLPLVIEFRNSSWQRDSVYSELASRGIAIAAVDCPPLAGLPAPQPLVTSDPGYIRFHGRNSEAWWSGTNASRYDYLYSGDELDGWVSRILAMSEKTNTLLITFNNHWRGQAITNALQLGGLLKEKTELEIARPPDHS